MRHDWTEIRAKYETGTSQTSLARDFKVSRAAIAKHVRLEGWTQDVSKSLRQKTDAKVAGLSNGSDHKRVAQALDDEATKRAEIILAHRKEWELVGGLRSLALQTAKDNPSESFERMKLAKLTAELTAIKQQGERRAWRIDDETGGSSVTVNTAVSINKTRDIRNWVELKELKRRVLAEHLRRASGGVEMEESEDFDEGEDDYTVEGSVSENT